MKSVIFKQFFSSSILLILCFLTFKVQGQANGFDCYQDIRLNSATLNQLSVSDSEIEFLFDVSNTTGTTFDIDVEVNLDPSTNLIVDPFTLTIDPASTQKGYTSTAIPINVISTNNNNTIIYIPDDLDLAGTIDFYLGESVCSYTQIETNFINNAMDINPENDNYVAPEELLIDDLNQEEDNTTQGTGPTTANNTYTETEENNQNQNNNNYTDENDEFNYDVNAEDYEEVKTQYLLDLNAATEQEVNGDPVIVKVKDEKEEESEFIKTEKGKRETIILVDEIYEIEKIFPNPAKRTTTVIINDAQFKEGNNTIIIFNSQLKPINKVAVYDYSTRINVERLPAGIYYLRLVNDNKESSFQKLIIY